MSPGGLNSPSSCGRGSITRQEGLGGEVVTMTGTVGILMVNLVALGSGLLNRVGVDAVDDAQEELPDIGGMVEAIECVVDPQGW